MFRYLYNRPIVPHEKRITVYRQHMIMILSNNKLNNVNANDLRRSILFPRGTLCFIIIKGYQYYNTYTIVK